MKNKELIIKMLQVTEQEYCALVETFAFDWLLSRFTKLECVISELSKSKMFWEWWKNQWEIRDEKYIRDSNIALINDVLEGQTLTMARDLYSDTHNPSTLTVKFNVIIRKELIQIVDKTLKQEESTLKVLEEKL